MNIRNTLFSDVHRPFFMGGTIFAVFSIGIWLLHLLDIMPYTLPFVQAHLHMAQMIYFFYPFFFFGFLLTIFPRLLSVPPLVPQRFIALFLCFFVAAVLFSVGLYAGKVWALSGVILAVISTTWISVEMLCMLWRSGYAHKQIPIFMWVGVTFAMPGTVALAMYIWTGDYFWGVASESIGIYGFLFPTIYAVAYRMVPIFTAKSGRDVVRNRFGLHFMLAFSLMHMLLMIMDIHAWYWLADFGLFVVVGQQCWQWRIWQSKPQTIQTVLHWALLWFPFSFLLSSGVNFAEWLSGERWLVLEQAALHALVVGGFGTLLLGMATRVTLGHAGRAVVADVLTTQLFLGFQIVPVLRVGCGMLSVAWPQCDVGITFSGLAWGVIFLLWGWRYMPYYVQVKR